MTRRFPPDGKVKGLVAVLVLLLLLPPFLGSAATVAEDQRIIKIGSDVTVEAGTRVRSVVTIGGQITVSGQVDKGVTAIGGSVVLTRTAVVGGNVTALGGVIVIARDAQVEGDLTEINSTNLVHAITAALSSEWEGWSWIFAVVSLAIFLVILVLALLIVALLPKPVGIVAEAITEHTFKVVLWGLLALVLIAPLALLLTISVVGIVLIPLEVILVVCLALMGFIAVGQFIGTRLLRRFGRPNPGPVKAAFWGLIVLWLIGWIPYIGWMVKVVALVVGLGATLVTRFGTYRGWACVPVPLTGPIGAPVAGPGAGTAAAEPPVPTAPGPPAPLPGTAMETALSQGAHPAAPPPEAETESAAVPPQPGPTAAAANPDGSETTPALPPAPPPFAPEPPAGPPGPEKPVP